MTPEGDLILRRLPAIRAVAIDVANNKGGSGRAQQIVWLADTVEDYVTARELGEDIGHDVIEAALTITRMLAATPFSGRIKRLRNARPGPTRYRVDMVARRDGCYFCAIEGTIERLVVLLGALAGINDEPLSQVAGAA